MPSRNRNKKFFDEFCSGAGLWSRALFYLHCMIQPADAPAYCVPCRQSLNTDEVDEHYAKKHCPIPGKGWCSACKTPVEKDYHSQHAHAKSAEHCFATLEDYGLPWCMTCKGICTIPDHNLDTDAKVGFGMASRLYHDRLDNYRFGVEGFLPRGLHETYGKSFCRKTFVNYEGYTLVNGPCAAHAKHYPELGCIKEFDGQWQPVQYAGISFPCNNARCNLLGPAILVSHGLETPEKPIKPDPGYAEPNCVQVDSPASQPDPPSVKNEFRVQITKDEWKLLPDVDQERYTLRGRVAFLDL